MAIDILTLLRTGNVVDIPKPTFSEFIVAAAEYFKENDLTIFESYYQALITIRPDISSHIVDILDTSTINLPQLLAIAYKRW